MKALEKDRTRRFGSARELADDLERHLRDEPALAGPPSLTYRASKYVRRHRLGVAAASVVTLALLIGGVSTTWQAHVARQERDRAQRRFAEVRELANSLVFEVHDQIADLPGSTPARQLVIERGLEYLDRLALEAQALETEGDIELLVELGQGYTRTGEVQGRPSGANLGDEEGARQSLEKAVGLFRQALAMEPRNPRAQHGLAVASMHLGELLYSSASIDDARAPWEESRALFEELNEASPSEQSSVGRSPDQPQSGEAAG